MNWKVKGQGNDYSLYEFVSPGGDSFSCKFNTVKGTLRLHYQQHHSVFLVDKSNLLNRKFAIANVYGSEIAIVTKSLWRENTGTVVFNEPYKQLTFKIDSRLSLIEVTVGDSTHSCDLNEIPHPGREEHYMPVLISLSWLLSISISDKLKEVVTESL